MNILNIELTRIEETKLGFEHWANVTYSIPILENEYTVSTWKYRDLVLHSLDMHKLENIF